MTAIEKPSRIFGRTWEWQGLTTFVTRPRDATRGGATLGVVSGRRRQGKSFLLQALTDDWILLVGLDRLYQAPTS